MSETYDKYEIGPFIKSIREEIGITQKQVSDAVGYSIQTVSKFENARSNPKSVASRTIINYILQQSDDYEKYSAALMETTYVS